MTKETYKTKDGYVALSDNMQQVGRYLYKIAQEDDLDDFMIGFAATVHGLCVCSDAYAFRKANAKIQQTTN